MIEFEHPVNPFWTEKERRIAVVIQTSDNYLIKINKKRYSKMNFITNGIEKVDHEKLYFDLMIGYIDNLFEHIGDPKIDSDMDDPDNFGYDLKIKVCQWELIYFGSIFQDHTLKNFYLLNKLMQFCNQLFILDTKNIFLYFYLKMIEGKIPREIRDWHAVLLATDNAS